MNVLILGATGTLGRATIKALLRLDYLKSITCLSRDELKQSEMRREFNDARLKFVLGDIRDKRGINPFYRDIDVCFHYAALKRLPELEEQPLESLKTNVIGTWNAAECAIENKVKYFVFSSTDKSCRPVNTYGASKFLSEQILFSMNKRNETIFSVYRWGNIVGSRGSVLPAFHDSIKNGIPAQLTDKDMTRFWLKIEDAVEFVLSTYQTRSNEIKMPYMKAASITRVLDSIARIANRPAPYEVVGLRPGEKIHEDIMFSPQTCEAFSSDAAIQYSDDELDGLMREALQ